MDTPHNPLPATSSSQVTCLCSQLTHICSHNFSHVTCMRETEREREREGERERERGREREGEMRERKKVDNFK